MSQVLGFSSFLQLGLKCTNSGICKLSFPISMILMQRREYSQVRFLVKQKVSTYCDEGTTAMRDPEFVLELAILPTLDSQPSLSRGRASHPK